MKIQDILLVLAVVTIWGLNFTILKWGVAYYQPFTLLFWRFFLTFVLLAPFISRPKISFFNLAILALNFAILYHAFLFFAMSKGVSVNHVVIVTQLNVPFTAILAYFFAKEKLSKMKISGMIIAFIGVVVVVGNPLSHQFSPFILLILCSSLSMSIFNIQMKLTKQPISIVNILGWSSCLSVFVFAILSMELEDLHFYDLFNAPWKANFSVFYMAFFATIIGFGTWFYLLKTYPVSQVVPFSLLVPIIGIGGSSYFLDESLNLPTVVGGLLTIAGVALIILIKPPKSLEI